MKLSLFSGFYVLLFLCIGCKKKEINLRTESVLQSFQSQLPDKLKFNKHQILDQENTGLVAIECLIPDNWTSQDRFYWDSTDTKYPARYEGNYMDLANKLSIRTYAAVRSSFTIGPKGLHGTKPPENVLEGIKNLIQKERKADSYEILSEKLFTSPKLENSKFGSENIENGMVRIAYIEDKMKMEEEFYGKLEVAILTTQSFAPMRTNNWRFDELFSCKAPMGKLESSKIFAFILKTSRKPTQIFYNRMIQIKEKAAEIGFQKARQLDKSRNIEFQSNAEIPNRISDAYDNMETLRHKDNILFSNYFGRTDLYKDETRASILLPAGYKAAWKNESGDVILSRISDFSPNENASGNWKLLEKF